MRRSLLLTIHFATHIPQPRFNSTMATNSVPEVMKAVQMRRTGGPEVLQYKMDFPVPVPGDGEILVQNEFIGINFVDVYWRMGMMGMAPNGIIGREGEGRIVALGPGNHRGLNIGDRVGWLSMGAYAEYTAVPAPLAHRLPADIEPGIAAASLMQGLTALALIHKVTQVKEGDWILVHAAAGGVGSWLCQLLSPLGVKIIATASTPEKLQLAKDRGAQYIVNYKEAEFVEQIQQITGQHGVDVVFDGIGREQTENNMNLVAKNGSIITYGAASGAPGFISQQRLAAKNIRLVGPAETAVMRHLGLEFGFWCSKLMESIKEDKIDVKIHHTYVLSDIVQVHQDLQGRKTTGKVLVKP
ncbi:unnamed protein product [Periconia digitata]|uniref:Enoyl reductase (ER) domain-containing protein n=1 Tax=Periconia digitata TaxID=1303443 RepID=A0A9W4USP6_9PLEO|nr:unnamed protein product [Periconia digitata]